MLLELSPIWAGILNSVFFPLTMIPIAWLVNQVPNRFLTERSWLFKPRFWDKAWVYEKLFRVRAWKARLPDGAKMMRTGFSKKKLVKLDQAYLKTYHTEAARGELAHLLDLLVLPLVLMWNPPWAIVVMVTLGIIGNVPCIISQRYNRVRILTIFASKAVN